MRISVSLLFVLTLVRHVPAQTYAVNEIAPAKGVKVTSRLAVGTREQEAESFMETNGLKVAYTLIETNGSDSFHYYYLKFDNQKIILQFRVGDDKAPTNRLLTTAWLSHGTNFGPQLTIRLRKAPETNGRGRFGSTETKECRPPPGYTIDSRSDALSRGDTIALCFLDDPPVRFEPVLVNIADDGTFHFGGGAFQVAGLTAEQAASRIQAQLVTNFFGLVFKVTVMRVQRVQPAD